jgi:2-polyprenyl-3-methyl-5-hydroxy-6-metoxy-1,4-benzoquinol methylase
VDYRKVFDESKHEMFEEIPFVPPVKVKEYGYARPTDLANSAPENHTRIDETDERGRYGVIYYSRPLSATQIRSFNLTAVPERERVNPPAEPETTDRVGTVPTFGGKLFESKSQKGPQYLRLTRQLAGLRKAMERYEEKYPDGNSAGNEKLGFDQEAAQEARENLEREEGETSEEFSDRFDAVNKREDDLNAIDSFRVRLESKIESIEKELAELESVRAKADLSTPYGYTKGPFGTLYSAPLRADSPEWKAMSKEQRREYIANRKDGNPDFDARSANTQRAGTVNTYRKAAEGMIPKGHKVVDYSAGLGLGADVMRSLGFSVTTMEPFPEKWASKTPVDYTEQGKVPSSSADTVTNFSALNVVPLNIRNGIVSDIARIVKPGGQAIFSARTLQNVQSAANKRPADEPGSFWVKNQGEENFQKGFSSLELVAYLQKQLGNQWTVAPSTKLNGAVAVATKNNPPQTAANIIAHPPERGPAAVPDDDEDELGAEREQQREEDGVDVERGHVGGDGCVEEVGRDQDERDHDGAEDERAEGDVGGPEGGARAGDLVHGEHADRETQEGHADRVEPQEAVARDEEDEAQAVDEDPHVPDREAGHGQRATPREELLGDLDARLLDGRSGPRGAGERAELEHQVVAQGH